MATVLDKELRRQISVDGASYTVSLDAEGLRLIGKGKRKPVVVLLWRDLLSGEAALAVALNASLNLRAGEEAVTQKLPDSATRDSRKKPSR
ncbi:hypothetical protein [Variovorax soli]|uniref:Uncharacterized protein n=1 Tax=Variovorax soli TaxID=376815 RepID=A0ABU1NMX3_9BURK|nr:hypothetical protein [Variovorax soli]MDR6539707.1 hypothetical protein [Variovorax soli]